MPVTRISEYFFGANTRDLLQKDWWPSTGSYPLDATPGIEHIAKDSGTISGIVYSAGQSIINEGGSWHVVSSLGVISASEKGAANGVATLDSSAVLSAAQIPHVLASKDYVNKQRFNYQTGTSYTVQASDCGVFISCFNSNPITVTIPSGLGVEFNFAILQAGPGQVSFVASGTTLLNAYAHIKSYGQNAVVSFVSNAPDVFVFSGATSA